MTIKKNGGVFGRNPKFRNVAVDSLTVGGALATFPATSFTAARTDAAQSFTGDQTLATGNLIIGTTAKGITTGSAIPLGLGTNNGVTHATVHNSGGFSVGNTTDSGAGTAFVKNSIYVGNFNTDPTLNRVNALVATPAGEILARQTGAWNVARADTSGGHINFYTDNGSDRVLAGVISSNGSTTTYSTSSDYRMKENVQPMANALENVMRLKPVTYTWKSEFAGTKQNGQGFIAHELQAVVPDCVSGLKDAVDEKGNPIYQSIDTSFLVATLTKAIQELNLEVQSLKAMLGK